MFNFSLESVLNHRRLVEENIQKELALLKMALVDKKKILQTYEETKIKLVKEFQNKQKEGTPISYAFLYIPFIDRMSMDIDKQKKTILEFEENVEKKRLELIEASKKKKTLERLKEKAFNTYKQGLIKNEQDFLNEVGIIRSNRKIEQER